MRGDISLAVAALFSDATDDLVKADFLTALHRKGETAEEILGFVQQLIDRAIDPLIDPKNLSGPMIDVCGTGGDGFDLFNVSTTIMFVLAAGGAVVVKHGNRSVTSCCGSADVLEALGVPFDLPPAHLRECVERLGLCFIFARQYHPAYRAIAEMRERLARKNTRTIFNLLGPLLNPARPARQLIGVFARRASRVFLRKSFDVSDGNAPGSCTARPIRRKAWTTSRRAGPPPWPSFCRARSPRA